MLCNNTGTLIGLVYGLIIHVKANAHVLHLRNALHAGDAGGGSMTRLCLKRCSRFGTAISLMGVGDVVCITVAAVGLTLVVRRYLSSSAKKVTSTNLL